MSNSSLRVWILAARPKTLWASIAPVIMGTAMAVADGRFHLPSALAAFFGAILIQIGTNYANDYFDFLKGADTQERLGPTRATQAGLVRPEAMKKAFIVAFGLAFLLGIYLVWRGGWPIVIIGLASIFLGVLYTATPFALGYTGLADIFVLIFFGPVAVAGTYYVQALTVTREAIIAGLAPGLISVALLTVNNLRDIEQDRKAGKKTMAVRFGKTFAQMEYVLTLLAALFIATYLYRTEEKSIALLLVWGLLLLAFPAIKTVFRFDDARMLNGVLASTGQLLLFYSLIFAIGWLI